MTTSQQFQFLKVHEETRVHCMRQEHAVVYDMMFFCVVCACVFTTVCLELLEPSCVDHISIPSSYLTVSSTHTAVGRFWSLVWRSGTHCLMSSEIRRVVLTVFSSFLRQSCLVNTSMTSTLEVFLNDMRYVNPHFTYLLTYLLTLSWLYMFRFKHMMMRSNCESAAFYRCGQLEWKKTNKKLKALTSTQQRLNIRQYMLNCTSRFT